ncbi:Flp family type IVb pilin [Maritalea porphyrae]|jgi:pilus assembly protein Flp/PilA|uniref:Flp family type IVb pilin n=1 Tax=Maritalea porphyrae TaxID=880732 RepID=UPI0022B0441C|nr:Flp family type IVb pilin [Maritalea porphyrae]MCZ4273891.1 Flp family type IVb pilin [Maritalea porphyrae]
MKIQLKAFLHNDSGATAIEYGLIAAVVAVVVIASFNGLGDALNDLFNGNEKSIIGAMSNANKS